MAASDAPGTSRDIAPVVVSFLRALDDEQAGVRRLLAAAVEAATPAVGTVEWVEAATTPAPWGRPPRPDRLRRLAGVVRELGLLRAVAARALTDAWRLPPDAALASIAAALPNCWSVALGVRHAALLQVVEAAEALGRAVPSAAPHLRPVLDLSAFTGRPGILTTSRPGSGG